MVRDTEQRGPLRRDPRLELTMRLAQLEHQKVAKELSERPVWSGYLKYLRQLRLDHMEQIVRDRDCDVSYERGVCDALALIVTYNTYDPRIIDMLERKVQGLRELIGSLQDADLLDDDEQQGTQP